jgi:glycosyltransferase involved in cell wall biosynthesis
MKKNINILQISVDLNYSCGVSKYVFSLLTALKNNHSYRLFFITNGGDALDKLNDINIKPVILNFSKGLKNIFNIYPNLKILKSFCYENEIDIIHTHHRYPEFLANIISRGTAIKTITTAHSLVKGKKRISFNSEKIIAVSNSVKDLLINYYQIPDEKITMLYNFIEPPSSESKNLEHEIRSELNLSLSQKIILYIGRITKIKGVDILIEAFKVLRRTNKNIVLLIIGQIYDNSINNTLKRLPEGIRVLNVVKDPFPYYSIADLVVLPSRVEPFPYVMLESGIMRKPFIGAKTGGIAEFIEDGVNGLLFSSENVEELMNQMKYLINDYEAGKCMGKNLYQKVCKQASRDKYISELNKIYDSLLLSE